MVSSSGHSDDEKLLYAFSDKGGNQATKTFHACLRRGSSGTQCLNEAELLPVAGIEKERARLISQKAESLPRSVMG